MSTKECVDYPVRSILPKPSVCPLNNARWGLCWGKTRRFWPANKNRILHVSLKVPFSLNVVIMMSPMSPLCYVWCHLQSTSRVWSLPCQFWQASSSLPSWFAVSAAVNVKKSGKQWIKPLSFFIKSAEGHVWPSSRVTRLSVLCNLAQFPSQEEGTQWTPIVACQPTSAFTQVRLSSDAVVQDGLNFR